MHLIVRSAWNAAHLQLIHTDVDHPLQRRVNFRDMQTSLLDQGILTLPILGRKRYVLIYRIFSLTPYL